MRIPESELIINDDGSVFHIHLRPEEIADRIIMVGDPGRVDMIAEYLTDIEFRHASREFVSTTGKFNGQRIHRTLQILRIGTSGALHADIPLGSYILSHISVGFDGVMNWYGNRQKVTMPEVEKAFKEHMGWLPELPSPYFVKAGQGIIDRFKDCTVRGVTISAPGFYGPQGRIVRMPLAMPDMLEKIESFRFDGDWRITNFEMESAPVAGFARHLGHDAATVCCAIANRYLKSSNPDYKQQVRGLVELALDRMTR